MQKQPLSAVSLCQITLLAECVNSHVLTGHILHPLHPNVNIMMTHCTVSEWVLCLNVLESSISRGHHFCSTLNSFLSGDLKTH